MTQPYNRCTYQKVLKGGTGKVAPVHAMQAYGGIRGTAPLPLSLGTRWPLYSRGRTFGTHWRDPEPV